MKLWNQIGSWLGASAPAPQKTMAGVIDSARRGGYKGYFYFPQSGLTHWQKRRSRIKSAQDAEWLYNHSGAVRQVVDGLALDEVDTGLWPKADTSDEAFNMALNEAFDNLWGTDARFFDGAKKVHFYSAQFLIRRHIRLHGEIFAQLLRPDPASGAIAPRVSFLPSHMCESALHGEQTDQFTDGILLDALGGPLAYRFADRVNVSDAEKVRIVPADDILHFHDELLCGHLRGESCLAPVLNKLFSVDDIERAASSGELLRTRIAYAISSQTDDGMPSLLPGAVEVAEEEVKQADGSTTKTIIQKIVANDGTEVDVADLPAGKTLEVVESDKNSAAADWNKYLLTDVAYATKYPPSYVFHLAGLTQGTVVRMLQSRVQRIIRNVRFFQMEPQYCKRLWTFFTWQLVSAKYFDRLGVPVPPDWYRMKVINPADMTVDLGREGRLYDERFDTGKMDDDEYHGLRGRDADDVDRRVVRRYFKRRQILEEEAAKLGQEAPPAHEVWPPKAGAVVAPGNDKPEDDEDTETENDEE
jgi:hypothetical protein